LREWLAIRYNFRARVDWSQSALSLLLKTVFKLGETPDAEGALKSLGAAGAKPPRCSEAMRPALEQRKKQGETRG
jgi:hypothetical protein